MAKKAVMVFRGDNPLMRKLESLVKELGVESISLPIGDSRAENANEKEKYLKDLGQKYEVVLTDGTMYHYKVDCAQNVYAMATSDWGSQVRSLVNLIDKRKKIIINPYGLDDHVRDGDIKSLEEEVGIEKVMAIKKIDYSSDGYLAALISEITKGKVAWFPEFYMGRDHITGKITNVIEGDSSDIVVLVDHHVYQLSPHNVKEAGFDKVEIYPVCPCCIGLEQIHIGSLEKSGFRVHKLTEDAIMDVYTDKILEKIKKLIE